MMKTNKQSRILIVAILTLAACPLVVIGQIRPNYVWKTPSLRGIRTIGGDFTTYSAGTPRSNYSVSSGLLRSSLSIPSGFTLYRGSSSAGANTLSSAMPRLGKYKPMIYGSSQMKFSTPMAPVSPRGVFGKNAFFKQQTPFGIQSYLSRMQVGEFSKTARSIKPITSFVPTSETGSYRQLMERGERAFKEGRYEQAGTAFRMALTLGQHPAETHLALVHTYCAQERYHTAAYHLIQAIEYFPDLPLASMSIRSFYGNSRMFVSNLENLKKASEKSVAQPGLYLLLAYFQYFDDNADAASVSLRKAYKASNLSKDKHTSSAILAFFKGMVAAGKAHGTLGTPTTQAENIPATTTQAARTGPSREKTRQPDTHGDRKRDSALQRK